LVHREVFEQGKISMKPHSDLDWIKKVFADLERHRGDPQIDAFMSELAETLCRLGPIPKPVIIRDDVWPPRILSARNSGSVRRHDDDRFLLDRIGE
jgi:hypothetical protein